MAEVGDAMRVSRRLVVELNERSADALTRRCQAEGLNRTTVVNRAVQVYDRLQAHIETGGALQLVHADGHAETVVFL